MIGYAGILVIIAALIIAGMVFAFVNNDKKQQEIIIKGKEYRKEHGAFQFEQSMQDNGLIKEKEWLKQKNKGYNPESYAKKIKYRNHFEDCECLVQKRGL